MVKVLIMVKGRLSKAAFLLDFDRDEVNQR